MASHLDIANDLPRYAEWAPTAFDTAGLGLPDRQEWRVLLTRTRDSDTLTRVNFDSAESELEQADPEGYETHRFGHWGPGWVEILLVSPESEPAMIAAGSIASALADYPILDGYAYSDACANEADVAWVVWGHHHFVSVVPHVSDEARDVLSDAPDACWEALHAVSGVPVDHLDDGPRFDIDAVRRADRDTVAGWVWASRAARREAAKLAAKGDE